MKIKHIIYTGLTGLLLSGSVHAQEQPSLRLRAQQLYDRYEYANAAGLFERLVDRKNPRVSDMERLAESYYYLNSYDLAENWYARVVQSGEFSEVSLWNYAEVLKQNGKYREAREQYQRYTEKYGASDRASLAMAGADSAVRWMAEPTSHKLRNERAVNTDLGQFSVFPRGSEVLYAGEPSTILGKRSGMTGQAYLRVYSAERNAADGALGNPSLLDGSFNSSNFHIGPIVADASGETLYVTRTYPGKDTEKHRENGRKYRRHNLELKIYRKDGNGWTESDFPYNNVKEYSLGHAALSADGRTLYYASDMPGGQGGVDIWYSELGADGSWGQPRNAGQAVNSAGDEMFPTVAGEYLYYSSDGFPGMGGLDIFRAKGERSSFSGRENLRFPVNSAADDFSFVLVEESEEALQGYLSSNRPGGAGGDDIYSFSLRKPKILIVLEGLTVNRKTDELIPDASVTLYSAGRQIVGRVRSDGKAAFRFDLDRNTPYRVLAEKQGFHADSANIAAVNPTKDTTIRVTLRLEPVFKVGDRFVLENIYYDFDRHNIRKDASEVLDQLVRTMRDNPTLKIELSSHTDSRGTHRYNEGLSQRRAQAAVDYIVSRGIARERLVAKGYGETRLVNRCKDGVPCTVEEHQANRRTEVEVLAF